ncbi:TVP38/TMEM64 family protein [Acetobacter sicerae]|nr:VTT domain-containing protein [Acetobacter sicerae]
MSESPMPDPTETHEEQAPPGQAHGVGDQAAPSLLSLLRPAVMLIVLLGGAIALREVPALHTLLNDTAHLRQGVSGRFWFCLAGTLWCLFGLPRQVLCFAAGVAYGLVEGTTLATVSTVAGAVLCWAWARWGAHHWARETMARRKRQGKGGVLMRYGERVAGMLARHPFETIVTLRLLPVGSSLLLNLFAGLSAVALWPFTTATLVGSLPQSIIFVLLGSGAQFGGPGRTLVAVALFVASGVLGYRLLRRLTIDSETDLS